MKDLFCNTWLLQFDKLYLFHFYLSLVHEEKIEKKEETLIHEKFQEHQMSEKNGILPSNKPWKGTFNKFMKERSLSSSAVFVMLAFHKSTVTNLGLSREAKSSTEFEFGGLVR